MKSYRHNVRENLWLALDTLQSPQNNSCPFAIPDAWVDIQVRQDPTGYEVALRGEDFTQGQEILSRAQAYARN